MEMYFLQLWIDKALLQSKLAWFKREPQTLWKSEIGATDPQNPNQNSKQNQKPYQLYSQSLTLS